MQIGPHTFHLHEIYGLSSTSTSVHPIAPDATQVAHTYPPTIPVPAEDEPSSECLVCLSSPREVVLLPCRHLVACKECAINMVEFGAGGAITHAEEPAEAQPAETAEAPAVDDTALPTATAGAGEEDLSAPEVATGDSNAEPSANAPQDAQEPVGDNTPEASPPTLPVPTPAQVTSNVPPVASAPPNARRKRRAKGWFCPVCRQRKSLLPFLAFRNSPPLYLLVSSYSFASFRIPSSFPEIPIFFPAYTSLLRITTAPPTMEDGKEGKRVSTSTIDHPLAIPGIPAPATDQAAARLAPALEVMPEEPAPMPSRSLRPPFLRRLSRRTADASSPV